ncbi:tRNA (adenosine(37)-N6)-dimethylallyltransferase MiaA [uncultured Tissierella sp.]|jgi:tRNA dimethylallyltransferase|uniref:tRNA (adenosine(37)-N6)-dimethylallyltransferase MiaA n=1 Tax=uncultured Tissierella sp. TaxID=448160 RepID=UPI002804B5C6|nr:tRNA (adenosine(37)-N6)-dimethylallyltransferase MiaA [uncultured Tissierella sp.]MDU5079952.1 tRNA (adenosine(37)-N6)-dimethylallyltransferase MiaA [Bacillota bacterium]
MKNKDNLFILIGPTAIGKTALSIELAKKMNGEIISADSMQIYKYMDIGSAKITKEEMDDIPHHLIDIVLPNEDFTVANFKDNAIKLIRDINSRNKIPIVAGGTGLYINSLVYSLNFTQVAPNDEIRNKLESLGDKYGNEYLHQELQRIDVKSAEKISVNDRKRIIRAIEIFEITGKLMSEYNENFRKPVEDYNLVMIGLNMDRKELYDRINLRVDIMIEEGLMEEVKKLLSMGYSKELVSMQGIGYKEIIMYLEGNISLAKSIEMIKQGTRNYAKRQLTWFRRDNRIKWVNVDEFFTLDDLTQYIIDYSKDKIIINK